MADPEIRHMKWWGWGHEDVSFSDADKPKLWPYLSGELGLEQVEPTPPVKFDDVHLPAAKENAPFIAALRDALAHDQFSVDKKDRLIHAAGKAFRDLFRLRRGQVDFAPDLIVYPASEVDVVAIVKAAHEHNAVLIPFGGGTNIAGCIEPKDRDERFIVSLDMCRMHRVLAVDKKSLLARIEAGVYGPHMEEQLEAEGVTLGHFPDSFVHSTLGGWVATRSAGMQSDKYGKIEDMVIALRMVTPSGTIVTRTVPNTSNGIDVRSLCVGSEGILGVITEVTVQVHRLPERKMFEGWLFPDFESGIRAIHECMRHGTMPVITRLNDPGKTALSAAFKKVEPPLKQKIGAAMKWYLRNIKGIDFTKCCMMTTAYEGDYDTFHMQRRESNRVFRKHGGVNLGEGPGNSFKEAKYDFPHVRDYLMDRGVMGDVSETSTTWDNLHNLYTKTITNIQKAIRDTGVDPWVGCHISHNYHTGASLYFTFGCRQIEGRELDQYLYIKKAAEDSFLQNGGTVSHHHAVGTEHLPWIEADLSPAGLKAVRAIKDGLDPKSVMNPGKILPGPDPLREWGLTDETIQTFNKAD
ncbi:MAG: FAD-binding oxidoreductase [Verrucomicrobiales bacterium]|nr:FAD-binding oxidoreductase [Verrucomicrobiales bacterium]